jgi:hypothetical protein
MKANRSLSLKPSALPVRFAAVIMFSALVMNSGARASERWATLEAIHQLENPYDTTVPGALGELGPYQFREYTWKMHTQAPFSRALDRRSSDAVAVKHYDWIKAELEKRDIPVTAFNVALVWNGGVKAVTSGNPPAMAVDYATRASNLAAVLGRSQLADAK